MRQGDSSFLFFPAHTPPTHSLRFSPPIPRPSSYRPPPTVRRGDRGGGPCFPLPLIILFLACAHALSIPPLLSPTARQDHLAKCPQSPVQCPHCGISLPKNRLSTHRTDECPGTPISCPVRSCRATVARGELVGHLASSAQATAAHLSALAKASILPSLPSPSPRHTPVEAFR